MRLHPPERIAEYVAAGWWHDDASVTWDALLRARVAERPDPSRWSTRRTAPRCWAARRAGSPGPSSTPRSTAIAAGLSQRGIGVDDVVGTQLPNTVELVITYLAITRLGAIVSPFPMPYREHELGTLGCRWRGSPR